MVAKIVNGKNIRGVLNYNENKVKNAEAKLLMAAGFPRDAEQLNFNNKLDRFAMLTRQNEQTKTNTMHISLNFSRSDILDEDLLKRIALDYMDQIGFGNQPFLVYQHYDAAHPHIHIATVNIADGGERIETHNIGKNQSEKARKDIEDRYRLTRAEDQQKETAFMLRPVPLEKVVYGKEETKAAISAIVREVTDSYKFTSLPELNAALRQFGIVAYRGEPGMTMFEKKGLVYSLLTEQGEKIGIPIKASSIYGKPMLKNLEKKYAPNETLRKPYGLRLKHIIDKAISSSGNRLAMEDVLRKQGIRILFRENQQGNIYGVTYIDNATRTVYNGSDLGKEYAAKAILQRLPKAAGPLPPSQGIRSASLSAESREFVIPPAPKTSYPANDQPVIQRLMDIALSYDYEAGNTDPYRKKRKKKRLQNE